MAVLVGAYRTNCSVTEVAANVERVFYYDCLNDIRKDGEKDADFEKRVEVQQATFDGIQSLDLNPEPAFGFTSAADAIPLPQPKPRAMGLRPVIAG